jgi:hypothetical protein
MQECRAFSPHLVGRRLRQVKHIGGFCWLRTEVLAANHSERKKEIGNSSGDKKIPTPRTNRGEWGPRTAGAVS